MLPVFPVFHTEATVLVLKMFSEWEHSFHIITCPLTLDHQSLYFETRLGKDKIPDFSYFT